MAPFCVEKIVLKRVPHKREHNYYKSNIFFDSIGAIASLSDMTYLCYRRRVVEITFR